MSAKIDTIIDKNGDYLYPRTREEAVTDENNVSLKTKMANVPQFAGQFTTTDPVPRDADLLGGRITAEDVEELSESLTQFVRYNPTTDYIEINFNGVWTNWKKGGLGSGVIYNNGTFIREMANGIYTTETAFAGYQKAYQERGTGLYSPALPYLNVYTVITDEKISVANYTKLCVDFLLGTTQTTLVADISAYDEGYIGIYNARFDSGTDRYIGITLSSEKDNFYTNRYVVKDIEYRTESTLTITKIWLE